MLTISRLIAILVLGFSLGSPCRAARAQTGDLDLTDVLLTPSPARSGETVRVDFFVQNRGPGAGQMRSYEILVDNTRQRFDTTPRSFPNGGDVLQFQDSVVMPTVSTPTSVQVLVRIVDDGNTSNNTQIAFITVNPLSVPDLAVDTPAGWSGPLIASNVPGATQSLAVIPGGQPVLISFGYQNLGAAFASPTVRVTILLDGFPVFDSFYPAMSRGQRRQVRNVDIGIPPAGAHTLELRLDDGNAIQEADESNNDAFANFRVDGANPANLNFSLVPGSSRPAAVFLTSAEGSSSPQTDFQPGDSVYTNLSIRNIGGLASGDFDVAVLLDGVVIDSFRQTSIPADGQALIESRRILTDLQNGGILSFVIDPHAESLESDETDNQAEISFTVNEECPADFNGDGFVDFFDYTDFVTAFETGGDADFNQDGFVDLFDYSGYVSAFEAGC
ncbi:MAG: hypothetical protein HEQ23_07095 [Tepidisphaera sp.]